MIMVVDKHFFAGCFTLSKLCPVRVMHVSTASLLTFLFYLSSKCRFYFEMNIFQDCIKKRNVLIFQVSVA